MNKPEDRQSMLITFVMIVIIITMDRTLKKRLFIGGSLWLFWTLSVNPTWTQTLLLLSPALLIPLGLSLIQKNIVGPALALESKHTEIQLFALAAAGASFLFEPSVAAAVFSIPWFLYTARLSFAGSMRLLSRRRLLEPDIGGDMGLSFLVVGGAWLTLSRYGATPMGFSPAIVQLTAVHFHYAGFALPIVASLTGRQLGKHGAIILPWATIVGVPFTALGIVIDGTTEFFAANFMALVGLFVAFALFKQAKEQRSSLLYAAALSLACGMGMASIWATTQQFAIAGVTLDLMARTHGSLNAFGFGFLGLLGLALAANPRLDNKGPSKTLLGIGHPTNEKLRRLDLTSSTLNYDLDNLDARKHISRKRWTTTIGAEAGSFKEAKILMQQWAGHHSTGIITDPPQPTIKAKQRIRLGIPVGPIHATATCEIVNVIDEENRYGFSYGTLQHHFQCGEELFLIERSEEGITTVTVSAIFTSGAVLTKLTKPLVSWIQNQMITSYLAAYNADEILDRTQ